MYTLIKIQPYAMQRDLYFRNKETGKIDVVFDDNERSRIRVYPRTSAKNPVIDKIDDSAGNNFSFLKLNEDYDCKFMLCGKVCNKNDKDAKCYHFISEEMIGLTHAIKTELDGNIYYISAYEVREICDNKDIYYKASRIDLVEVNGVAHQDCLDEVLIKVIK